MARGKKNITISVNTKDNSSKKVQGINQSFLSLKTIGIAAVVAGLALVATTMRKGLRLFGIQEKAVNDLTRSMKNNGTFTREARKDLLDFASAMQSVSTYGDEEIIPVMTKINELTGLTGEEMKLATKATLDYAAATGKDLNTAAAQVANTLGTSQNQLRRYGIEVDGAANSQERLNSFVENTASIFGGAAQAQAQTFEGRMQQLKNRVGDLYEIIGDITQRLLTRFIPAMEWGLSKLEGFGKKVQQILNILDDLREQQQDDWHGHREQLVKYRNELKQVNEMLSHSLQLQTQEGLEASAGLLKRAQSLNHLIGVTQRYIEHRDKQKAQEEEAERLRIKEEADRKRNQAQIEAESKAREEAAQKAAGAAKKIEDAKREALDGELKASERHLAQQRSLRDVSVQEELEALQTIYDAELGTVEQREALELRLFQYRQQIREQEAADIQASIDAEKAMREAAANDLAALTSAKSKEAQAIGRASAIYNITIATYEAAMNAYKALAGIPVVGPALGAAAAGAVSWYGYDKARSVSNAPMPKFAHGGLVQPRPGGTQVTMGEAGETELGLPASKVKAFLDEAGVSRGATTINVPVYLDGKQIAQVVTTHQKANQRRKT